MIYNFWTSTHRGSFPLPPSGGATASNTWFPGPTWVCPEPPHGISVGSAVFSPSCDIFHLGFIIFGCRTHCRASSAYCLSTRSVHRVFMLARICLFISPRNARLQSNRLSPVHRDWFSVADAAEEPCLLCRWSTVSDTTLYGVEITNMAAPRTSSARLNYCHVIYRGASWDPTTWLHVRTLDWTLIRH